MKHSFATPLLLAILVFSGSCSRETSQPLDLRFDVDQSLLKEKLALEIRQLKFFVYDVYLLGTDGEFHRAEIIDLPPWQHAHIALLKLDEQGQTVNNTVKVEVKETPERISDQYQGIKFSLGLPADLNHQDPLLAKSPLNISSMFWSWQMGHKFFRLDVSAEQKNFAFHVGSTGCQSPSPVRPPASPCAQPNIATITLMGFDPHINIIQINLRTILRHIYDDTNNTRCTGNYRDIPLCRLFIKQLGLSPEAGTCEEGCMRQNLFLVGKK